MRDKVLALVIGIILCGVLFSIAHPPEPKYDGLGSAGGYFRQFDK